MKNSGSADVGWWCEPVGGGARRAGTAVADPRTGSVHVRVEGIGGDAQYRYGFVVAGAASPEGRFRTLPADRPYAFSVSLKRSEVVVTFDVSQPIARQIEGARKRIEAYATYLEGNGDIEIIKMRNRSDRWPTYLRLLDAADAGAKTGEIAAALFPTIENEDPDYKAGRHVRNWTAAAQELRDGGYRFMTLKHDK